MKSDIETIDEIVGMDPACARKEVFEWEYGQLRGAAALRADIEREAQCFIADSQSGLNPSGDGLLWRLALLNRAA